MVDDEDILMLNGKQHTLCIKTSEIPILSKQADGNICMRENIVRVAKL